MAQNYLNQSEGMGLGMGRVRVEEQAVEGKDPKWRPAVCKGEMSPWRSEEGEPWDRLVCFRRLSRFFKHMQKGFPRFA